MDDVQDIKSRLDIVDIIQEYLPLKPAGTGSFKGLCPFHGENTPSFFGNRPRQSWHCFGCDQGGDVIDFVMRMEGMEFRDALEHLAQKAGVTLSSRPAGDRSPRRRIFDINALASKWFRNQLLKNPAADAARAYAASRGIDPLTGDVWGIGYAPDGWETLVDALTAQGVSPQELVTAGLAGARDGGRGVYSRFRDRLMFTIADQNGQILGFTGRLLSPDAKEQKYVNTPETAAYKKGDILFGLDKAKGEIKRRNLAVIVEGNMDVITSHRCGVQNVIASSGTALTETQLRLLSRYTMNLALAFDADAGGMAAAKRGVDVARGMGFSIRMVLLPDGAKDPDDAVRTDVAAWKEAITNAPEYTAWVYRQAFRAWGNRDPESKKRIAKEILPEIKSISDPVERDGWVMRLADDLGVSADAIRDAMRTVGVVPGSRGANPHNTAGEHPERAEKKPSVKSRLDSLYDELAALLALKPDLRGLAESVIPGYAPSSEARDDRSGYLAILADRVFEDRTDAALERDGVRITHAIRDLLARDRRNDLARQMQDAERAGDTERIRAIEKEFQKLS